MRWLKNLREGLAPHRRLLIHEGDSLPTSLPRRDIVVAREEGEYWTAGMKCPCGCNDTLELMLIEEVTPHWRISLDARGRLSFAPSVWRDIGCRSHFWLRHGRVIWCE